MGYTKYNYWPGWTTDAKKHFGYSTAHIQKFNNPKVFTPYIISKHNELLDWITEQMVIRLNMPLEEAKNYVDQNRIGFEKCLEK